MPKKVPLLLALSVHNMFSRWFSYQYEISNEFDPILPIVENGSYSETHTDLTCPNSPFRLLALPCHISPSNKYRRPAHTYNKDDNNTLFKSIKDELSKMRSLFSKSKSKNISKPNQDDPIQVQPSAGISIFQKKSPVMQRSAFNNRNKMDDLPITGRGRGRNGSDSTKSPFRDFDDSDKVSIKSNTSNSLSQKFTNSLSRVGLKSNKNPNPNPTQETPEPAMRINRKLSARGTGASASVSQISAKFQNDSNSFTSNAANANYSPHRIPNSPFLNGMEEGERGELVLGWVRFY